MWDPCRVITFNLSNLVLKLLHLVRTYDTQDKHLTAQVTTQIHYINNCSLHMSFEKLILYFAIYTQMALQASFGRVLFILCTFGIINLLLDP